MRAFRLLASLAAAALIASSAAARADSAMSAPLAALKTMVTNLGYTPNIASDNESFSIDWQGKYNYEINFVLSKDNTIVYAYVDLVTLTPAQLAKLQTVKILEFNDSANVYFSSEKTDSGERLILNTDFGDAGLTPQSLRGTLEDFVAKLDATDTLWNTNLWK